MSGFCGFLCKKANALKVEQIEQALSSVGSIINQSKYVYSYKDFSIGILKEENNGEQKIIETTRYFLLSNGRIDNRDFSDLLKEDVAVIDYLLEYSLDSILQNIRGDFILIIYDKKKNELLCIRDQLGVRPFYYLDNQSYFFFASEIKLFWQLPGICVKMDQQWIADALSAIRSEKYRTPYEGVKRLIPGNKLLVKKQIILTPYWILDDNLKNSDLTHESAIHSFSEKFEQSVRLRIEGYDIIGAELSGGLDSAGVTAIADKVLRSKNSTLYTLSNVLSKGNSDKYFPFQDEYDYSKNLVDFLGLQNHLLISAEGYGVIDSLKQTFVIQSGPVQEGFNIFSDHLYDTAKTHGLEILLSGFGGDEGVSSKAPGFFRELRDSMDRTQYKDELLKRFYRKGLSRTKANLLYMLDYNIPALRDIHNRRSIKRKVLSAESILDSISPQFLNQMDIRKRFIEEKFFPIENTVRKNQYRKIMHNHISQRFEYSYLAAKSRGIKYAYPLWDIDLLEFYYTLPANYKFRDGIGRALYRESIRNCVPDQIRLRNDKGGFTIPTVPARILKDFAIIEELIVRSKKMNHFHFLDYDVMLTRLYVIKQKILGKDVINPHMSAFINALQVLLLQDMQRSGEFNSGIEI